jgi:hypothetical protein
MSSKMIQSDKDAGSSHSLAAGVNQASGVNYLGNPETVQFLIRQYAWKAIERRETVKDVDEGSKSDMADAVELAKIFLGMNPLYTPIKPWNSPGQISDWLALKMNQQDIDPIETVASYLIGYLCDLYNLYKQSISGEKKENWGWQIDATVNTAANDLMGIELPTATKETLAQGFQE